MKKKSIFLMVISLLLIVIPFFINVYSIYKLLMIVLGIILLEIIFIRNQKRNIFLFSLPVILMLITYGIDYFKTYAFNLSPIFVLENKINNKVSIYNSLFYRIYKCDKEYVFNNSYINNFVCDTKLLEDIDINMLLSEPKESFNTYKNNFIKVSGKISKINGTSNIILQAYFVNDESFNGHVEFNETSRLIVNIENVDISKYRVYDYITVIGHLYKYNEDNQELVLINTKLEESNLYDNYEIQVIESNECSNAIKKYTDNIYTHCIDKVYLKYKVDLYDLSYALKDKKISFADLINNSEMDIHENIKLYKLEKINILACSKEKNILMNKGKKVDYSWCEE